MPGTKERAYAREIHRYIRENMPWAEFVGRKSTNRGCWLFDRRTGAVIKAARKNWEMLEWLTSPSAPAGDRPQPVLFEVPQTISPNTMLENACRNSLDWLTEVVELTGELPTILTDEDGFPCGLRTSVLEFTRNGQSTRLRRRVRYD